MRILPQETTALLIDIQEKLFPHMYDGESLLANCLKLTEGLQTLSIPITVTQQYTKGLGLTILPIVMKFPDFSFSEKITFSCIDEPSIDEKLNSFGKKFIILYGIEAHVCVLQTCIDLVNTGRIPVVVEDCISSRNPNDKQIAIERMRKEGAVITTMESILLELTGKAGTEIFKKISAIIK